MAIRLFIGNLPQLVAESELREHFSTVGPLSYVSIPTDRETGRQRGFAFLEFKNSAHAEEAMRNLNNKLFKGSALSVKEARARDDRTPSRSLLSRPPSIGELTIATPPGNKPNPDFHPDASTHRSRGKAKGRSNSERIPKGPMREVVRGQFFGEDDDDEYVDCDDLERSDESFADRESNSDRNHTPNQFSDLASEEFNCPLRLQSETNNEN